MGSELGVPDDKLEMLSDYRDNPRFTTREQLALAYAEAMTITGDDVSDQLFEALRAEFGDEGLIILTEIIAWENASSKFNRALRIPSQQLWKKA